MQFHVAPSAELPIYRQLVGQILDGMAGGRLSSGSRLPSHRELAERLVISPHTVEKAYHELKRQGLVRTRPGHGTFVERPAAPDPAEQRRRLYAAARHLLAQAHTLGAPLAEVRDLLGEVDEKLRSERQRGIGGRS